MMAAMVFSGSRAGMLLGGAEFLICIIVSAIWDKKNRFFYVCALVGLIGLGVALRGEILEILEKAGMYTVVKSDEARMKLIDRSIELFKEHPVFGHGIGFKGNYDLYNPKKGAICFYHMMIPQIIGSMGCLGIAAYAFQGIQHLRIGISALRGKAKGERGVVVTLLLSYLGVLMMSQVNPGLFCPMPYGLIAMALFAAIDGEKGLEPIYKLLRKNKE
jgi:O-antigen ligase